MNRIRQALLLTIFTLVLSVTAVLCSVKTQTQAMEECVRMEMAYSWASCGVDALRNANINLSNGENSIWYASVSSRTMVEEEKAAARQQVAEEEARRQQEEQERRHAQEASGGDNEATVPVSNGFVTGEAGVSSSRVALANQIWEEQIPQNIKDRLIRNGWSIVISSQSLSRRFGYSYSIAGLTVYATKTIYLDNRTSAIRNSLAHEVGHAVDAIGIFPSDSPYFMGLMEQETVYAPDGDKRNAYDAKERFANVFQYILQYGDTYASYSPQTYEFVKKYMAGK